MKNYLYHFKRPCRRIISILLLFTIFFSIAGLLPSPASAVPPFSCAADGTTSDNLYTEPTTADNGSVVTATPQVSGGGIFNNVMYIFKQDVGMIMSKMYCSVQQKLRVPISAALTLVIVVFGVMIATGMVQFTTREILITFMKIALVWVFATQADFAIGIAYRFFIGAAELGSNMIITSVAPSVPAGSISTAQPDSMLSGIFHTSSAGGSTGNLGGISIPPYCASIIAVILFLLVFFMPMVMIFIIMMIITYIRLYAGALFAYLKALVLISFLFVLAPVFLCFALFKTTQPLFEQWIKYLTTFSLQIVIVFGFLAMLSLVDLGTFFRQILGLIKEYDVTLGIIFIPFPMHICSICEYTITGNDITCTGRHSLPIPDGYMLSVDGLNYVYTLWNLLKQHDFVVFVVSKALALWIIGHVMADFLKKAPELARQLGGVPFAAALGGKSSTPGTGINFIGAESIEAGFAGFKNQFSKNPFSPNIVKRVGNGLQGFGAGLLYGASDAGSAQVKAHESALKRAGLRVDAMEKEYEHGKKLTKGSYDTMMAALGEVQTLQQSGTASKTDMDAALHRLESARKNNLLASTNEGVRNRKLIEANREKLRLKSQPKQLRGIFGVRDSQGRLLQEGGMDGIFGHAKDDDINRTLAEKNRERREINMYGKRIKQGGMLGKDMYYFLKMPDDVGASSAPPDLELLRERSKSLINALEGQIEAARQMLPHDHIQEIEGIIMKARNELANATTVPQCESIVRMLESVQFQFGKIASSDAAAGTDNTARDNTTDNPPPVSGNTGAGEPSPFSNEPALDDPSDPFAGGGGFNGTLDGNASPFDQTSNAPRDLSPDALLGMAGELEQRLTDAGHALSPTQQEQLSNRIEAVKGDLLTARNQQDLSRILAELNSIQRRLG